MAWALSQNVLEFPSDKISEFNIDSDERIGERTTEERTRVVYSHLRHFFIGNYEKMRGEQVHMFSRIKFIGQENTFLDFGNHLNASKSTQENKLISDLTRHVW